MPIFETKDGQKYDVDDEYINDFRDENPDAKYILERNGQKYRVAFDDYQAFIDTFDGGNDGGKNTPQAPQAPSAPKVGSLNWYTAETAGDAIKNVADNSVLASATKAKNTEATDNLAKVKGTADVAQNTQGLIHTTPIENKALELAQFKAKNKAMFDSMAQRTADMGEYYSKAGANVGKVVETAPEYNAETGEFETQYITPTLNREDNKAIADAEAREYKHWVDVQSKYVAPVNMTTSAQLRRVEERIADIDNKMHERAQQLMKEEEENKQSGFLGFLNEATRVRSIARSGMDREAYFNKDSDYQALALARRQLEDQRQQLQNKQGTEKFGERFWGDFGRGLWQSVSDIDTWDFGASVLNDAKTMSLINNKIENNIELTDAEANALEEIAESQAVKRYVGDLGSGYNWGSMTGQSLGFTAQMALTGGFSGAATGIGTKAASAVAKAAAKKIATESGKKIATSIAQKGIIETAKSIGKGGLKKMATEYGLTNATIATTRALGVGADILLVRAPLHTISAQGASLVGETVKSKYGKVVYDDRLGTLRFVNDKSWSEAAWQTAADKVIENASEMIGAHFFGLTDISKAFGARNLTAAILRATRENAGTVLSKTSQLLQRIGVNGYFGEVGEEYTGQLWRTMLNLESAKDDEGNNLIFSGKFNGDIWGGMAMSFGMMSSAALGANYAIEGVKYGVNTGMGKYWEHQVNKASAQASRVFSAEQWENMRQIIDATDNADMSVLAQQTIADNSLSESQKHAALTYMERSMNLRGYNLGRYMQSKNGMLDADAEAVNQSYADGYESNDAQEMADARKAVEVEEAKLRSALSGIDQEGVNAIMADVVADPVTAMQRAEDEALRDAIADYANAKAVYDGMQQRVADDIDTQIAVSDATIDRRTNRNTGKVQSVTLKNDKKVYVVGGTLNTTENGSVDFEHSDESIIVMDETGALEYASPKNVLSIDNEIDPAEEKAISAETIRQQAQAQAEANMSGKLTFTAGEQVQIKQEDGTFVNGTIVGPYIEDDKVIGGLFEVETQDGIKLPLEADVLQTWADEARQARVEQFDADRSAEREQTRQAEQASEAVAEETAVPAEETPTEPQTSALERVPTDEQGNPIYEQVDAETAWDAIVEQTQGDVAMAQTVANDMVKDKEKALKAAQNSKSKGGATIAEKIASEQERKANIQNAEQELAIWQAIASVPEARQQAMAEAQAQAEEEAERIKAEEARRAEENTPIVEAPLVEATEEVAEPIVEETETTTLPESEEEKESKNSTKSKSRKAPRRAVDAETEILRRLEEEWSDAPKDVKEQIKELADMSVAVTLDDVVYGALEEVKKKNAQYRLLLKDEGVVRGAVNMTGISAKELQKSLGLNAFASRAKGGVSIEKLAEIIYQTMDKNIIGANQIDDTDLRDMLIEAIRTIGKPSDLSYRRDSSRIEMAERLYNDWKEQEERYTEEQASWDAQQEAFEYAEEEWLKAQAKALEDLPEGGFMYIFADEFIQESKIRDIEHGQVNERSDNGDTILQGAQSDNTGRVEEGSEGRAVSEGIGDALHIPTAETSVGGIESAPEWEVGNEAELTAEELEASDIAPYTISPAEYTTKKGKVLDMHLVKFGVSLTKEQLRAAKELAKADKGWYDREQGGFMMRSEESAKQLAETILNNEDAVDDAQPVSLSDTREVVEEYKPNEEPTTGANQGQFGLVSDERMAELKARLRNKLGQLNAGIDPEVLAIGLEIAVGHLDRGIKSFSDFAKVMIEDLGDVVRPYLKAFYNGARDLPEVIDNGLSDGMTSYDEVRTFDVANFGKSSVDTFDTAQTVVAEQKHHKEAEQAKQEIIKNRNTQRKERDEQTTANTQIVASEAAIVASEAASGIEEATTEEEVNAIEQEVDKQLVAIDNQLSELDYIDNLHSGMRVVTKDGRSILLNMVMHEGEQVSVTKFSKPYVRRMYGFHKGQLVDIAPSDVDVAATIRLNEGSFEAPKQTEEKSNSYNGYKIGDKVIYAPQSGKRESVEATIHEFEDYGEHKPVLDTGMAPVLYEVVEWNDIAPISEEKTEKAKKSSKKSVTSQQSDMQSLFDSIFDNQTEKENGLQRNDAVRTERLSANGNRHEQGLSRVTETSSESEQQGSRGTDNGRETTGDAVNRTVRPRLSDAVTEKKNTRNNHSERGKDHAPTSVDARIEANIKAIELAKQLLESGEQATQKQMQTLRKFSGWGGLGKAFNEGTYYAPNPIAKQLRELLGETAYQEAVMSANSAYYTPAYVVDTLWDIAEQMGFKGGNILEGSAGIGNILGQMPTHISERSNIHAIEIDGTSGGILSLLYPDAKVEIKGFEETRIANGSVDLAITNVPFVTGLRVNDTTGDKDLSKKFHNIHDFCIAKNVRKLREGGLGIFITSNGTLDNSKKLRDWVVNEGGADFVGAFRMHNKTFGGTGVTSDIIVIRKRVNGKKSANAIDVSTVTGERMAEYDTGETRKVKGQIVPIVKQLSMDYNQYFVEHPENMAGEMHFAFEKGDTFRPTSKGLYPKQNKKQEQMLAEFVQSFTAEEFGEKATKEIEVIDAMPGKKIGEVFVNDGKLYINAIGAAQPLEVNANKVKGHTKVECFEAYSAIKEALAAVLEYQITHEDDKGLKPLLAKLNKAYDDFVATYGHFNKNTAIAFLRNDVDYANVFALEKFEESADANGNKVQKFGKTDVFSKRVIEKEAEPMPTNVKDGIVASIFKFGRVDIPYIAEQLGKSETEVKAEIIESGYGFEDPATRQVEVSYQYLSGNVREKLRQAQENNENGEFDRNIKALQGVMPMTIPAHLIDFTLGSSWIEPKLYEEYVKERTDVGVQFTAVGGTWFMNEPYYTAYEKNRAMGVTSEMLGRTVMGHTLIEAAIQNKSITVSTVKKNWDGSTETITDKEATQACSAKIDEIRQDFKEWARQKMQSDAEMSERMERVYNDTFNNYVPMSIPDEFVPEYFGGASHKFKMRPHQGRAIVRGTMQPLLLAHEVGTGKSFTLISTAMEMRRLGTARKPMIVVQNATVGQFVASAKELYPNAKILTLEESDRSADGRKNFYAKIKYNDWDMIVVPQSTFEFIPDSEERQMAFVQGKIEEKMLVLEQMKEADPDGKSMITRQAEREIALLEEELAGLSGETGKKRTANDEKKRAVALQNAEVKAMEMLDRRTDDIENFDDMGIDALLIDEAHEYKHLGFVTAMQRGVKGVDPSYSKKSQGVFLKTQAVLEKNNGRNVIFATGTPISNTAAEIWTFMRYLMPADTMKEYDIYYFDDFVRNFGNIQQMLEFTTSGKFKENNRFAGYVNLPELVRIWSGVSDTVLTKEAGGVSDKIPDMEGGKAQDLYLPQTRALRSIMKYVKAQLERYDKMSGKEKKENSHIPLTMYGIAKAAAVDARLVQSDAEDDVQSKTNEAVRQTLRSLKESADYKGTVAIFADNYQNKESGFNLYEDIRTKLIAEGIPADEIVVIKSGMTVKKKLEIFEKVNRGEVRVILGSTFTLGTGVNIQERLYTLIHLDAPNRPMDYTQRNGRILRQGNLHKAMGKPVRVLRFGVEDSLDVTAYQRLKTKGAIADSIMNGKQMMANSMTNRVLEEEEDVFGDTVAQLSGSEYAMLKNNAEKNIRKYASRKKQWEADQTYIHNAKPRVKAFIKDAEKRIEDNSRYLEAVRASFPDGKFKNISIGKHRFNSVEAMDDFFKEHNKGVLAEMKKMKESNATMGDEKRELKVNVDDYTFVVSTKLSKKVTRNGVTLMSEVERKMTYSCPELGITDIPVHQNLLRNAINEIVTDVISGKDFEGRIESAELSKKHNETELEQLLSREGKPFEYEAELKQAQAQYDEYSVLMKKELAEKEAKYAVMDSTIEAADDISNTEEDDNVLYRSSYELTDEYGDRWLTEQTNSDGRHTTQVKNTLRSYEKFGEWVERDSNGREVSVLDASSGLGLGTEHLRNMGLDVEDVEPYPSADRIPPTYSSYSQITKKYDYIISNAVLNVIPDDWRKTLLHQMADKLKIGGKLVINVRSAESIKNQGTEGKTRITLDDESEILVLRPNGSIKAYQKGFTKQELKSWCEEELGDGYDVEIAYSNNAGGSYDTAVVITKHINFKAKYGLSGVGPTAVIQNENDLIQLKKVVDVNTHQVLEDDFKAPRVYGSAYGNHNFIVIFSNKTTAPSYTSIWWHEAAHIAYRKLNLSNKEELGLHALEWMKRQGGKFRDHYDTIVNIYDKSSWATEATARMIQCVVEDNGVEKFLNADFGGNEKLSNLAKAIKNVIIYGKEEPTERDILRHAEYNNRIHTTDSGRVGDGDRVSGGLSSAQHRSNQGRSREDSEGDSGNVRDIAERQGSGVVSDEGVTMASDPVSKAIGEPRYGRGKKMREYAERQRRLMVQKVQEIAQKLKLDNVEIVTDASTLSGKRAKAKGYFNPTTGKIVIVIPNHASVLDVEETVLHEAVAHYGLRKLFGKHFDTFLDNVYESADPEIRKKIAALAAKNGWDFRKATEEYLAMLAEDTEFESVTYTGWWFKVKELFRKMLDKLGLEDFAKEGLTLSDNELRYILFRSYQHLQGQRGLMFEAEDAVKQYELGVGNYSAPKVAESGEDGDYYRDGDFTPRDRVMARDHYERVVSSGSYQFREAVQDSMLGLRRLMESILPKTKIEEIAGSENAYIFENRMSSTNAGEQHVYFTRYMKPLLEEIGRICRASKVKREALTEYLMAKHGLERNEYMRKKAEEKEEDTERDFAGLTGLTGEADWQRAEEVARQIVEDFEGAHNTDSLWEAINNATKATLEKLYMSGILSKEQYEEVSNMYSYYIPLRGWDETTSDEVYGYLTSKDGPLGSVMKKAKGRSTVADDPIATIALMADDAIRQGNRNLMKVRFLNFVLNHPSDLVSVKPLWLQYNEAKDEWEPIFPELTSDMTPEEVELEVEAFEERMKQLSEEAPDKYKHGRDAVNIPYKVVNDHLSEHQVIVKRNGRTFILTINGNPRAAQAINGLTNPDVQGGGLADKLAKWGTTLIRELSALYTTRNPDFVISNFMRDMIYTNSMVWAKESPEYALHFHANCVRVNATRMAKLFAKWELGTLGNSGIEGLFYQFMTNGGETGYTEIKNLERHKKDIAAEIKKQRNVGRKVWSLLGTTFEIFNRSVENMARFSAFVTSIEMGRSVDRAIYDAKEISVNFNKKGAGSKMYDSNGQTLLGKIGSMTGGLGRILYVFFNAGVQGMANLGRTYKKHPIKMTAGTMAMVALGYVVPMLIDAEDDDDSKDAYYNLPEYIRRTNICMPVGDSWITIPLPIDYRALYGLGEMAYGVSSGKEHYNNEELAYNIAAQFSQVLPIDMLEGNRGMRNLIPSYVQPIYDVNINESWTGVPISKQTPFNEFKPEWQKAYQSTDIYLVDATRWLNEVSGGNAHKKGDIDINPADIEYLLSSYLGGVYTFPSKILKTGETAFGDREFEWRNIPLANRLVKQGDERTAQRKLKNQYFNYGKKDFEVMSNEVRGFAKDAARGDSAAVEHLKQLSETPEYKRWLIYKAYKPHMTELNKLIKETPMSDDSVKMYENLYYEKMREVVNGLNDPEAFMESIKEREEE